MGGVVRAEDAVIPAREHARMPEVAEPIGVELLLVRLNQIQNSQHAGATHICRSPASTLTEQSFQNLRDSTGPGLRLLPHPVQSYSTPIEMHKDTSDDASEPPQRPSTCAREARNAVPTSQNRHTQWRNQCDAAPMTEQTHPMHAASPACRRPRP